MIFDTIKIHTFGKNDRAATLRERLDMRKHCGAYEWTPAEAGEGRGFYQSSRGLAMSEGDCTFRLRLALANDILTGSRFPEGYYVDDKQDATLEPIIARLNHGRGFLAGWTMGAGRLANLDADIYATAEEAARAAHDIAERDAEKERDYQTQEREKEQEAE